MRKTFMFILLLGIISYAQEKNKQMIDEKSGKLILIGYCDRTAFADTNYSWWFNSEYDNYEYNASTVDSLKHELSNILIKIVMGSWCSDSRREVPRFYKLLDAIEYNYNNFTLISTDRKKESPEGNISELEIKYVPTFIVYRNDKEIGRIIETPKISLEKDLLDIIRQ
ncbi:MAG: thioredoxin family protein [Ignavibacteria bacterium]|nr:thioredoxin family protein [Ignavibacteria bacterium]